MSVTFAGDGGKDVGDGTMKNQNAGGLQDGGPLMSPKGSEQGKSAPEGLVNVEGQVPDGSGVKFAGDVGN